MDLELRAQALEHSTVFAQLPRDDLTLLASVMRVEAFAAGETVCEHGESADDVYVLVAGDLDVFVPMSEAAVRKLGPGDVFGEYAMFSGGTRTSTIVSRTQSTLLSLDSVRFREFLLAFPQSAFVLLETSVRRLIQLESRMRKQEK
jgi:CRP-like cAMP-binding protein